VGTRIARFLGKNVLAVIAIFLALGGTAYASFVVSSNRQIGPDTVSGHNPPSNKHSNLIAGSVSTQDLANSAVTSQKLANGAAISLKIANGAVSGSKVSGGAISSSKLADGAVSATKLAPGAVRSSKVLNDSLSLDDLVGADVSGSINVGPVAAHSCLTFSVDVTGAEVGQVPYMGFIGSHPAPPGMVFQILKVSSPDSATLRVCNVTDVESTAATNVGVRVITFG
jgi:hypothetical protein